MPPRCNLLPGLRRCAGIALLAVAATAEAGVGTARWIERPDPGALQLHAAAFDSDRGRMVLFGGVFAEPCTYEWDGRQWFRVAETGPGARDSHAMVYDAARHRVVLFGGVSPGGFGLPGHLGDTWEWDGNHWILISELGPSPRERHAMAYDQARGRVVLFGGTSVDDEGGVPIYGDTWEWDGTAWTLVSETGPLPRFGGVMSYDAQRERVVMFGGADGNDFLRETWEWDGNTWSFVSAGGPTGRIGHTMIYDSVRQCVVLHGGMTPFVITLSDTWEWDGQTWQQRSNAGPAGRRFASLAYDPQRGRSILFGGAGGDGELGDLWVWDGDRWNAGGSASPTGRESHAMAYDTARGVAVLFGGRDSVYSFDDETWEWNGQTWAHRATGGPERRAHHALAFDSVRNMTVLFGGADNSFTNALGDTWTWDGSEWHQHFVSGPSARYAHAAAFDHARGRLVLFGGYDVSRFLGDTWEWDGRAWELRANRGPRPRWTHSMAYDAKRGRVVLFGGATVEHDTGIWLGDTWEWDGTTWVQVAATGPAPRQSAAAAYSSIRGTVVLHGGTVPRKNSYFTYADTWEWDGASWRRLDSAGPSQRFAGAMTYDERRKRLVLFGGSSDVGSAGVFLRDLWELRGADVIPSRPR